MESHSRRWWRYRGRWGWSPFILGRNLTAWTSTNAHDGQYDSASCKQSRQTMSRFSVDRVFRKEAIDSTHLPEFHQIEGTIMEPGANLQMLVTTLKTFYEKMGYPEVRVRPAYFPYTEPSLEVEVKWKGKWSNLQQCIFRPEVTEPLGITSPVCAWGMWVGNDSLCSFLA